MPKGKKFDAAQKHFMDKEAELKKEIRGLQAELYTANRKLSLLSEKLGQVEAENEQLKDHRTRLLQYMDLKESDIKTICQKDKQAADFFTMMNAVGRGLGF